MLSVCERSREGVAGGFVMTTWTAGFVVGISWPVVVSGSETACGRLDPVFVASWEESLVDGICVGSWDIGWPRPRWSMPWDMAKGGGADLRRRDVVSGGIEDLARPVSGRAISDDLWDS